MDLSIMTTGIVKSFDMKKGAGLIKPDNAGADVAVHISVLEEAGIRTIEAGQPVSFDVQNQAMGPNAINLKLLSQEIKLGSDVVAT